VRSELFAGFADWRERIWVHHKLFLPQGSLAILAAGWSLPVLKAVSLPWFALLLLLLVRHLRARRAAFGENAALLAALLFLAHPLVVDGAYTFRPEMCLASLGFASYLALERGLARSSPAALRGGALLAGLGVLVHLDGLVFVAAGAALLASAGRVGRAFEFLALSLAVASLYLADAWNAAELETLWRQLRGDPALDEGDFSIAGAFTKLLREPQRWIRHGEDVATTVLVGGSLLIARRRLWRDHRPLLVYVAVAVCALGLLAQSKTPKYLLPLLPGLLCLVAVGSRELRERERVWRRTGAALFVAVLAVHASRSWRYFHGRLDVAARHAEALRSLPGDETVVTDLTYAFDELPRRDLRGIWGYRIRAEARGEDFDLAWLLEAAGADGVDLVVLDTRRDLSRRLAAELAEALPLPWRARETGQRPAVWILSVPRVDSPGIPAKKTESPGVPR